MRWAGCQSANGACTDSLSSDVTFLNQMVTDIEAAANIDTSHIYISGYFQGTLATFQAFCGETGNDTSGQSFGNGVLGGGVLAYHNDWSALGFNVAGWAAWGSDGPPGLATTEKPVLDCTWPSDAHSQFITISSKGDASYPADDARTGSANQVCSAKTANLFCYVRVGTLVAASGTTGSFGNSYKAHYTSCSAFTTNTVNTPHYTSYTQKDTTCSSGARYRWLSLGTTTSGTNCSPGTGSPSHSWVNFECMLANPTAAQLTWNYWNS